MLYFIDTESFTMITTFLLLIHCEAALKNFVTHTHTNRKRQKTLNFLPSIRSHTDKRKNRPTSSDPLAASNNVQYITDRNGFQAAGNLWPTFGGDKWVMHFESTVKTKFAPIIIMTKNKKKKKKKEDRSELLKSLDATQFMKLKLKIACFLLTSSHCLFFFDTAPQDVFKSES